MERSTDVRKYPRHQIPVPVDAPAFGKGPLEAMDISAGGIFLMVRGLPAPPKRGEELEVSFQVAGTLFPRCRARVAWTQQNRPGTWGVGLEVQMPEEERKRLAGKLEKL